MVLKQVLASVLFAAAILAPMVASAAPIDATLIPDGTYVVKVERVSDAQHITVMMQNGVETTLTSKDGVNFGRVKPNDTIKVSLIKGMVPVFAIE